MSMRIGEILRKSAPATTRVTPTPKYEKYVIGFLVPYLRITMFTKLLGYFWMKLIMFHFQCHNCVRGRL